jgi:hypothetical protein
VSAGRWSTQRPSMGCKGTDGCPQGRCQ